MMWFNDNPEWAFTLITIASCIAINLTLPLWLRLAKLFDDLKHPANSEALDDDDAASESDEDNTKGSNNNNASPMSRIASSVVSESQYSLSSSIIGSQVSAILEARPRRPGRSDRTKRRRRERDVRFAAGMQKCKIDGTFDQMELILSTNDSFSRTRSLMSRLSVTDVSINDGVTDQQGVETMVNGIDTPYKRSCWKVLLEASEWDSSLASLSGFYMVQEFAEKIFAVVELAVISHFIGITEANAFIMVSFLFEVSGILIVGFQEAIGVLVPQADGSENDLMVGRYLQLGIFFSMLFQVPGFVIWSLYMYDIIIWFGFDEITASIAQNYTYSIILFAFADGVNECLVTFLDVIDHEKYVTLYAVMSQCLSAGAIIGLSLYGVTDMVVIGFAQSFVGLLLLFVNTTIVVNKGWLNDYSGGLVKSFGLKDWRAMRTTFATAIPLAIAWLLSFGEWQVMLIFAQSIGPDEVASWNMLGYIWELFEALTEAISGAAEVRVGFRMGAAKPQEARKMSEKSIYLGSQLAITTAGALFAVAEFIVPWITPNLIYQKLIFDQLPLIGFGGILMVPGLIIEGIFCAQGRVRLMTIIEIVVSWFIAIPIAALLVYYFNFGLNGIVSGLVVGYSTGATILLFYFLRSNWEELSEMVVKQNATEGLQYLDTEWDDLPPEVQEAASTLGYTKVMWESNREPDSTEKSWDELTEKERKAAKVLGYNKKKWNGDNNDGEQYEEYDFDELPTEVREAAKFLGFTRSIWDKGGTVAIENKDWTDLTEAEKKAACTIGYTKEKWDDDSDSSSSSSDKFSQVIKGMPAIPEKEEATAAEAASAISGKKEVDYDDYDFDELPTEAKKAAEILGYTASIWDNDGSLPIEDKSWSGLTKAEKNAASTLGYTKEKWDEGSESSLSSSENTKSRQKPKNLNSDTATTSVNSPRDACVNLIEVCDRQNNVATNISICSSKDSSAAPWDEAPLSDSMMTENDIAAMCLRQSKIVDGKGQNSRFCVTKYGEYRFDELPVKLQKAALNLGYTRSTWDLNLLVPKKSKTWDSFTPAEMDAALTLGCTKEKWEHLLDSW